MSGGDVEYVGPQARATITKAEKVGESGGSWMRGMESGKGQRARGEGEKNAVGCELRPRRGESRAGNGGDGGDVLHTVLVRIARTRHADFGEERRTN